MAKDIQTIKNQFQIIQNETIEDANTAARVGGAGYDLADFIGKNRSGIIPWFETEAKLNASLPNPSDGEQAWVGEPYPGKVWAANGGIWSNTGTTPDVGQIDLTEYTQSGGSIKTALQLENDINSNDARISSVAAGDINDNVIDLNKFNQRTIDYIGSAGNIVNQADGEDLVKATESGIEVLKLADKIHNPSSFTGKGRKYMRKEISGGRNVLTPDMVPYSDTVYRLQYDYDLDGGEIDLPANSTFQFEGGSITNGTIVGNNTTIKGITSLDGLILKNTFLVELDASAMLAEFTYLNIVVEKIIESLKSNMQSLAIKILLPNGRIPISKTVKIPRGMSIIGGGRTIFDLNELVDDVAIILDDEVIFYDEKEEGGEAKTTDGYFRFYSIENINFSISALSNKTAIRDLRGMHNIINCTFSLNLKHFIYYQPNYRGRFRDYADGRTIRNIVCNSGTEARKNNTYQIVLYGGDNTTIDGINGDANILLVGCTGGTIRNTIQCSFSLIQCKNISFNAIHSESGFVKCYNSNVTFNDSLLGNSTGTDFHRVLVDDVSIVSEAVSMGLVALTDISNPANTLDMYTLSGSNIILMNVVFGQKALTPIASFKYDIYIASDASVVTCMNCYGHTYYFGYPFSFKTLPTSNKNLFDKVEYNRASKVPVAAPTSSASLYEINLTTRPDLAGYQITWDSPKKYYRICVIIDKQRKLGYTLNEVSCDVELNKRVTIPIGDFWGLDNCWIRVYRGSATGAYTEYIEFQIAHDQNKYQNQSLEDAYTTKNIIDNSIEANGIVWRPVVGVADIQFNECTYFSNKAVTYIDVNVLPTSGNWGYGDVIRYRDSNNILLSFRNPLASGALSLILNTPTINNNQLTALNTIKSRLSRQTFFLTDDRETYLYDGTNIVREWVSNRVVNSILPTTNLYGGKMVYNEATHKLYIYSIDRGAFLEHDGVLANTLRSGITANRPIDSESFLYIGFTYFDTELNMPIYYTSVGWVDSTGNPA